MRENFERALKHVLQFEGGYVDHPRDPGGATNFGVTIGTLSEHLGRPATKAEVRNIPMATVREIYRKRYWNRVRGDDLPSGVDLAVFDLAVNSGVSRAAKMLQAAVKVPQDGRIGPATLAAVNARTPKVIIYSLTVDRLSFLQRLRTWSTFGRGWKRRVLAVEKEAQKWAAERQIGMTRVAMAEPEPAAAEAPEATQAAFYSTETEPMTGSRYLTGVKGFFQSRAIWANIIGMLALTPVGAQAFAGYDVGAIAEAVATAVGVVMNLAAIYFRVSAEKKVVVGAS